MVPLAQAAGSAPCYHTSWVAPRVTTLWGLAGWGAPPQRTEQPWPAALHPGSPGAASRGTSTRAALCAGGGRVASGEHVLGLLGSPQVELERDRLGDVRADVPGAVAEAVASS